MQNTSVMHPFLPSMFFFLHHFPLGTKAGKGRNKEKAKKNKEANKKKDKRLDKRAKQKENGEKPWGQKESKVRHYRLPRKKEKD